MYVKLADLNDLLSAVKTIRKLSPNTGNGAAFRQGIVDMPRDDMHAFCQAVDTACLMVGRIEQQTRVEVVA